MPLGTPTSRGTASGSTTATTASFTPSANALLIAWVAGWHTNTLSGDPTCSGGSLTWTSFHLQSLDPGGTADCIKLRGFWAQAPSSPSSMTVTGGSTSATTTGIVVTEITGADTDLTNVAGGGNSAGDPSATLGTAPAATSAALWCVALSTNPDATGPSGFTMLNEVNQSADLRMEIGYDNTSPGTSASVTSTSTTSVAILVEVKESAGFTGTLSATADVTAAASGDHGAEGTSTATAAVTASAAGITNLWTPAQITTQLWLDAADTASLTFNASTISQWNDLSGNARHVSQATATNQPTYNAGGLGSLPAISFDGTDNYLFNTTPFMYAAGSLHAYAAMRALSTETVGTLIFGEMSSTVAFGQSYWISTNNPANGAVAFFIRNDGNTTLLSSASTDTTALDDTPQVIGWSDTGSAITHRTDGTAYNTGNYTRSGTLTLNRLALGATVRSSVGNFFKGYIGEVVVAGGSISETNRRRLEGYLAYKWRLDGNLPAGHTYKNAPPLLSDVEGELSASIAPTAIATGTTVGKPTSQATATGTTSATSASFTPTGSALLIAWVSAQHSTALPANPTCSGGGLTWTLVIQKDYEPTGSQPKQKLSCFRALVPSTPSAMTVTGGSATAEFLSIQVTEIANASTGITNIASCEDPIGDPNAVLLTTPSVSSVVLSCATFGTIMAVADATVPSGFTNIAAFDNGTLQRMEVAYRDIAGTGAAWTSDNSSSIGISIEVAPASGIDGDLAATVAPTASVAGDHGAVGALSATSAPVAAMSGTAESGATEGTLSASVTPTASVAGDHGAVGALSATSAPVAAMSGTAESGATEGTLSASVTPTASVAGDHGVTGTAVATVAPTAVAVGDHANEGTLTATVVPTITAASDHGVIGTIAAEVVPAASISSDHGVTGTAAATTALTATLSGAHDIAGALAAGVSPAASFTGAFGSDVEGALVGSVAPTATVTADHGVTGTTAAIVAPAATATGDHGATGSLDALAALSASMTGAFGDDLTGTLSATLSPTASAAGVHGVDGVAAPTIAIVAAAAGEHGAAGVLDAVALSTATAAGIVGHAGILVTQVDAVAAAIGDHGVTGTVASTVSIAATFLGTAGQIIDLSQRLTIGAEARTSLAMQGYPPMGSMAGSQISSVALTGDGG